MICGSPVIRHADYAVFLRDNDRRANNILESIDFIKQAWLPCLRLRLDFRCHGLHKNPQRQRFCLQESR